SGKGILLARTRQDRNPPPRVSLDPRASHGDLRLARDRRGWKPDSPDTRRVGEESRSGEDTANPSNRKVIARATFNLQALGAHSLLPGSFLPCRVRRGR